MHLQIGEPSDDHQEPTNQNLLHHLTQVELEEVQELAQSLSDSLQEPVGALLAPTGMGGISAHTPIDTPQASSDALQAPLADPQQLQIGGPPATDQETDDLNPLHLPTQADQEMEVQVTETTQWQILKAALFSSPPPPIFATPIPPQKEYTCTTGRVNLRRSVRLAAKRRPGSMLQRAQEALAYKLGTHQKTDL